MSLFRHIALFAQALANATPVFAAIERLSIRQANSSAQPPIVIVGCPRSGTTLLYEVMTTVFRTAYPTNAASLLYRSPVLATVVAQAITPEHEARFISDTGYIAGLLAPSEAGALMRHWFTGPRPLAADDPVQLDRIVTTLAAAMGGPLVLKNLYLDRAIDLVLSAFPGCMILRLHRDHRFTAQSILATRLRELGSPDAWWGPRPQGVEAIADQSAVRQVAWQITQIDSWIDRLAEDRRVKGRLFSCDYSELCARPAAVLNSIAAFYREVSGAELVTRGEPPASFAVSEKITLPSDRWRELETALAEYGHGRAGSNPA